MLILLSPAKTIDFTPWSSEVESTIPDFLQQSFFLIRQARQWSVEDISKLMKVSNAIAQLNFDRFQAFSFTTTSMNSKQAVFAFNGDAYQGLDARTMSPKTLTYMQNHLRILSGLYGVLRPADLIQPHRLEMGLNLKVGKERDLCHFWKDLVSQSIENQLNVLKSDVVVNLASVEYSKVVDFKKLGVRVIAPVFLNQRNGEYKMVSFWAKKARGMMTRFIVENEIENPDYLIGFDRGYYCDESMSEKDRPVFISSI